RKKLWENNKSLGHYARGKAGRRMQDHPEDQAVFNGSDEHRQHYGLLHLGEKWSRAGCRFVPLITEELCFRCSLDILFLRPEESGMVIRGGDLDNRLKTLFDALRVPKNVDETGGLSSSEDPTYCLLEDDSLISEVRFNPDEFLFF